MPTEASKNNSFLSPYQRSLIGEETGAPAGAGEGAAPVDNSHRNKYIKMAVAILMVGAVLTTALHFFSKAHSWKFLANEPFKKLPFTMAVYLGAGATVAALGIDLMLYHCRKPKGAGAAANAEEGAADAGQQPEGAKAEEGAADAGQQLEGAKAEEGAANAGQQLEGANAAEGAANASEQPEGAKAAEGAANASEQPEGANAEEGAADAGQQPEGASTSGQKAEPEKQKDPRESKYADADDV